MDAVLLQYGAVGVIAILGIAWFRISMARLGEAYDREKERADRLEAELTELNKLIRMEYMSALQHSALALSDANRAVNETLGAIRERRRQ